MCNFFSLLILTNSSVAAGLLRPLSTLAGAPAHKCSNDALIPSNEQRSRDGNSLVGHKNFVQVHHTDRDEPIGCHYRGNVNMVAIHGFAFVADREVDRCGSDATAANAILP
mmetsp:Transcript_16605/g.28164  ORF Transcript_16605/g.28164 Transcript_16605/m.28164 type:complete len:111 (+) Transcript_16605:982-1314(+)